MKKIVLPLLCYCEKCHKRVYKKDRVGQYSSNGGFALLSRCCNAELIFKTSQEEFPPKMDAAIKRTMEENQRTLINVHRLKNPYR